MCGILGTVGFKDKKLFRKSLSEFSYRGPDYRGTYFDKDVFLGHNRLAVLDLEKRANQPMSDSEGQIYLVYNGELFNFYDLRKVLSKFHSFSTESDTEVLLYGYKILGTEFLNKIQGMYAFGIYDKKEQKIIVARDHVGIKPLYYYRDDSLFIFSSELKGILQLLSKKGKEVEIDRRMLDYYYSLGYIPSPHTLYKKIYKLQPGSFMDYDIPSHTTTLFSIKTHYSRTKKLSEFYKLMENKIMDHLISDVPVGLFFSGGTDSSVIASVLKKNKVKISNFSIQMSHKKEDEKYFRKISNFLGIHSNEYKFGVPEFDRVYRKVLKKMDEPFVDASIFPTYYLAKIASKKVKIVLSGEGGDEFFYGYNRHRVLYRLRNYKDYEITFLDKLYFRVPNFRYKNYIFKLFFRFNKQPISYYLATVSIGKDIVGWDLIKNEIRKRKLKPLDIDKYLYLENDLLRKIDFATSYCSIEGRVPLLDIDIVSNAKEFERTKLLNGNLKYVLKNFLLKYIPPEMVFRNKSGFGIDMKNKFKESKTLKQEYFKASLYLGKFNLLPQKYYSHKKEWYLDRYANFCFSIVVLYNCLKNNEEYVGHKYE